MDRIPRPLITGRVHKFTADRNWGGRQPGCGGTDHTIIIWGVPIAIFRWDNINDMDVIDLTVREIQQPSVNSAEKFCR